MTKVKYSICDKLVFFNTASLRFETVEVKSIQVIATKMSKDEAGENRLDECTVLYQLVSGLVLSESELFRTEAEAREHYRAFLEGK